MKVIIRLYKQHDLDLIALHKNTNFRLTTAMKKVLEAYVENENIEIASPEPQYFNPDNVPKIVTLFITLDENKNADIIEWISNVKKGYRNSAIKNLIRGYLNKPLIYVYKEDVNDEIERMTSGTKKVIDSMKKGETKKVAHNKSKPKRESKVKPKESKEKENVSLLDDVINGDKEKDATYIENVGKEETITLEDVLAKKGEEPKVTEEDEDAMFSAFDDIMNSF